MPIIQNLTELRELDSEVAYPRHEWFASEAKFGESGVADILISASEIAGIEYAPEGPSDFQDGAAFMCAQEYGFVNEICKSDVLSGIYFSKFHGLVVTTRIGDRSNVDDNTWNQINSLISENNDLKLVSSNLLESSYDGAFISPLKDENEKTWWWRFFSPWY